MKELSNLLKIKPTCERHGLTCSAIDKLCDYRSGVINQRLFRRGNIPEERGLLLYKNLIIDLEKRLYNAKEDYNKLVMID